MRRVPFVIVGLLFPLATQAAALSPWVDEVLGRIDTGVATANLMPAGSCSNEVILSELENNLSMARARFSVTTHLADESQYLRERTLCFQSDRMLLEEKMQFLLGELDDAVQSCNQKRAHVLRDTYVFADNAYRSFLAGSIDPSYQDPLLRKKYSFDSKDAAEQQQDPVNDPASTAPLCPYTTDYAPHAIGYTPTSYGGGTTASTDIKSYGCDITVLRSLPGNAQDEAQPLVDFMNKSDTFARNTYDTVSQALSNIDAIIAVLTGRAPPASLSGTVPAPPHEEKTGCLRPLSPEDGSAADPKEIEYTLLSYPNYFDAANLHEEEVAPGTTVPTYGPTPEFTLPTWLLFRPRHDFFQSFPNPVITLRAFGNRREEEGKKRPLPIFLTGSFYDTFSMQAAQLDSATTLQGIGANIERETAVVEALSRDSIELSAAAAKPLRDAVRSLTSVVEEYLPKEYIPSLTFFLLRDCVDGHCQQTLKSVTKRSFNPYCHPYVSGKYSEEKAAKRCYCDPSLEADEPDFWKEYCSEDLSGEMSSYESRTPTLIPACVPGDPVEE